MQEGWKSSFGGCDDILIIGGKEQGLEEDWVVEL